MVEAVLSTEKSCLVEHATYFVFVRVLNALLKNEKRNHQMQRALFYVKHADKLTSPKHNLLLFQVRTNRTQDQGLLGSRYHNFRYLQHSCSSLAVVLLTCLEDITQNYPFFCSYYIPEIRTTVLFLPY